MPDHTQSAREAKKGIANDPQASSSYSLKEKEKRQKKKEKMDKLVSDVTYYGAGAMAGLGGGALGSIPSKGKKTKSPSQMMKDYFNSKNKPKYQAPKVGVSRKELSSKPSEGVRKFLKRM